MKHKRLYILFLILLTMGTALLLYFRSDSRTALVKRVLPFSQDNSEAALLRLHPLASDAAIKATHKQTVETWEEWIDARTEAWLGVQVKHGVLKTQAEIAAKRPEIRERVAKLAEMFKPYLDKPPTVGGKPPWHLIPGVISPIIVPPKKYEGPQTVEGLMEAFDAKYVKFYPDASSYDAYYSRSEWLQMLFDKGMHFENRDDYNVLLNIRGWVINAESHPEWWKEGKGGVSPTNNFETYKNEYIDRQIWQQEIYKRVTTEDPTATGIRFFDDRPDKYLVTYPNTLYVNRDGSATRFWGTGDKARLTDEQQRLLIEEGVHPEGVDVFYVDNDYNILSEKPPPFDMETYIRSHITDEQQEEEAIELEEFGERLESVEDGTTLSEEQFRGSDEEVWSSRFDAEAATREATAKAEFERFQNDMRQRKEFETMVDKEVSRELAKQFSQQFLSKYSLKQGTSKQLENALQLMFQHGFEEGFRRVRQDSPSIADQLERYLAETERPSAPQKRPQRSSPPKPSESGPPETEAP